MSNPPAFLYPDTSTPYLIKARYLDPDGRNDLRFAYLKLDHPDPGVPDLLLQYNLLNNHFTVVPQQDSIYIRNVSFSKEACFIDGMEGWELSWEFTLKSPWPAAPEGVSYWLQAIDSSLAKSVWERSEVTSAYKRYGITFISHGYIFPLSDLVPALLPDPISGWMNDLATSIKDRLGGRAITGVYNKATGIYDIAGEPGVLSDPGENELILLFDWKDDSSLMGHGFSEAAADAAFASLYQFKTSSNFQNLHLIGHSRGCVVVSEMAERLLKHGFPVFQTTYLDPHDWGAQDVCDDLDVNAGLKVTLLDGTPHPDKPTAGVVGWGAVAYADTYWQDEVKWYEVLENPLAGRPVSGTHNTYMSESTHINIHGKYKESIDNPSLDWGYNHSRIGNNGSFLTPQINSPKTESPHDYDSITSGVFNGDFKFPLRVDIISNVIPGWFLHPDVIRITDLERESHLALTHNHNHITHNRMCIPENGADRISFSYKVEKPDPQGELRFFFNDDEVAARVWPINQLSESWIQACVDIPPNLKGSVATFTVSIQDLQSTDVRVVVDNFSFSPAVIENENMVFVEGGSFMMGSNEGESDEKPVHPVTVSSFYIGKYEVTQIEWNAIMDYNPSWHRGDNRPAENLDWYEAIEYCNKRSIKEGLLPCYNIDTNNRDRNNTNKDDYNKWYVEVNWNANGYRLPTEAEWEFSAGGGIFSNGYNFSGSNDHRLVSWSSSKSIYQNYSTNSVGKLAPNELGIYDMSGNVWEWCWDWYNDKHYSASNVDNPRGPVSGSRRVLRGGCCSETLDRNAMASRVKNRFSYNPSNRYNNSYKVGLRVVRFVK